MPHPNRNPIAAAISCRLSLLIFTLASSAVLQGQNTSSAQETITLDPFTVSSTQDRGYQASNAASGTRISAELRNLPQNIQVVTSELLADTGALKVEDAIQLVSGVNPQGNQDTGVIVVRGFLSNKLIDGFSAPNGTYTDDLSFYDRLEFIKGPAPLLYGSASPGGAINYITKKPKFNPETKLRLSVGSYDFYRAELDASRPFKVGKVSAAARLSLAFEDTGSFRYGEKRNRTAMNPSISFRLSPKTSLSFATTYFEGHTDKGPTANPPVDFTQTRLLDVDRSYNLSPDNAFRDVKSYSYSSLLTHSFNEHLTLRQALSYSNRDMLWLILFGLRENAPGSGLINNTGLYQHQTQWDFNSQTDLAASFTLAGSQIQVVVGHEYAYSDDTDLQMQDSRFPRAPVSAYAFAGGGSPIIPNFVFPDQFTNLTNNQRNTSDQNAIYGFAQAKLLKERLLLSGGVRKQFVDTTNSNRRTAVLVARTDDYLAPQGAAMFKLTPDVGLYANYGEAITPNPGFPGQPQKGKGWEAGAKFDLLDRRISGAFGVFDITRTNIPRVDFSQPSRPTVLSGEEQSKGFDTDLFFFPLPGWQIKLGYAYMDAVVVSNVQSPVLQGTTVVGAPQHSGKLWTRYDFRSGALKRFYVLGGATYRSDIHPFSDANRFRVVAPGFTYFDIGAGYSGKLQSGVRYRAGILVKNVTDKVYRYQANMFGDPRTYTFNLAFEF